MVNTYGLKMENLEDAAQNTENYSFSAGLYSEVFYDYECGTVWTKTTMRDNWTEYRDDCVHKVLGTTKKVGPQEIADAIYRDYVVSRDNDPYFKDYFDPSILLKNTEKKK